MSDSSLVVQESAALDLFFEDAEQQLAIAAERDSSGYDSAYIRAQSTSVQDRKQHPNGVGSLEIRFSRDDIIYPRVAAVFPIDVIGTVGGFKKTNPTPRKWPVDYNDTATREKYGYTWCQSKNGVQPDAVTYNPAVEPIHGRTLVHPQADGEDSIVVRAGWGSDKTREIDTTVTITEDTYCNQCVFAQSWWAADSPEGSRPRLNAVCGMHPSAVFYIVGADTYNKFGSDHRCLAQVQVFGQSARTMFGRKNDTEYQKQVGIFAPMEEMIAAKPVDGVPANAVILEHEGQRVVVYFPFLLGAIVHGEKTGSSNHPFLYNPATTVRDHLRKSTEDMDTRVANAIKNAASTMLNKIGVFSNHTVELQQLEELLKATTVVSNMPETLDIYEEFRVVKSEYHTPTEDGRLAGRVKLTTPISPDSFQRELEEDDTQPQLQQQPAPKTVEEPATVEERTRLLQSLQNADANFLAADDGNDDEEDAGSFFANSVFED